MSRLIKDIFLFIKSGRIERNIQYEFHKFIILFLIIEILNFLVSVFIFQLLHIFNFEVTHNVLPQYIKENGVIKSIVVGCIIAPVIEEVGFRLALVFSARNFAFMLGAWFYLIMGYVIEDQDILSGQNILLIRFILSILFGSIVFLYLVNFKYLGPIFSRFWERNPLVTLYTFVLIFSFLHALNYTWSPQMLFIAPLLTLPQTVNGIVFSYVRLKYGLIFAFFLHSMSNLIVIFFITRYFE